MDIHDVTIVLDAMRAAVRVVCCCCWCCRQGALIDHETESENISYALNIHTYNTLDDGREHTRVRQSRIEHLCDKVIVRRERERLVIILDRNIDALAANEVMREA